MANCGITVGVDIRPNKLPVGEFHCYLYALIAGAFKLIERLPKGGAEF